ncbi:DUF7281 domain-containing protein [Pontibacter chinhatensis]|uniref:DUF7281 domain-containing protein n=1 Tax=Pontibacter chinhatensis TaxID=1436961 RepID=A0A1I2QJL3_9BACT|nr:hypothetical protein [Pontibacter chinhatensis]SFG27813.1 hypothetical protein SAMN05421739_10213 [Pontibacter chinhatensis]
MKLLSKGLVTKLLQLSKGAKLPASKLQHPLVAELLEEGILADSRLGRSKSTLYLPQPESLKAFLFNRFSINDLEVYLETLQEEGVSRAQLVQGSTNSKLKKVRTFEGFLVNCYEPIKARLHGNEIIINPPEGIFHFIHAFEQFEPHPDVTIVGVENAENFSRVENQRHLFKGLHPLFVSRYPQSQSKDMIRWLQAISNPYLHFGDFDFAGIGIYLHEYKRYLGTRATWFVPAGLEAMLLKWGNKNLYNAQKVNFDSSKIEEPRILEVIELMHQYKRGLEQEAFIINSTSFDDSL